MARLPDSLSHATEVDGLEHSAYIAARKIVKGCLGMATQLPFLASNRLIQSCP
jgi:hypothetical protein